MDYQEERQVKEKDAFDKASIWMQSFIKSGVPQYGGMIPSTIDKYESTAWWDVNERNMVGIIVTELSDIPHALVTLWNWIDTQKFNAWRDHETEATRIKTEQSEAGYPHLSVFTMHDNYMSFGLYPALIVPESLKPVTDTLPDDFQVYVIAKSPKQKLFEELNRLALETKANTD